MKSIKLAALASILSLSAGIAMASPAAQGQYNTHDQARAMQSSDSSEFRTILAYQGKR